MTNQPRRVIQYSYSFKQKVVREIEEGMSIQLARDRYGIGGFHTIQRWLRKFGKTHLLNQVITVQTVNEKDRLKQMENEIKKLKAALADSLMAQRCLEDVIEEANKEYKTDLKKNFGDTASQKEQKSSQ